MTAPSSGVKDVTPRNLKFSRELCDYELHTSLTSLGSVTCASSFRCGGQNLEKSDISDSNPCAENSFVTFVTTEEFFRRCLSRHNEKNVGGESTCVDVSLTVQKKPVAPLQQRPGLLAHGCLAQ